MSKTKVVTGKVRFSYAQVFEAKAIEEGNTPKFSVSIIIPKSDKTTIAKIEKAVEAAKQEGRGKWNSKIPAVLKTPLRDGDLERPEDEAYENSMFFNASSNRKPGVVDADINPIMDRDEFYSGCYGRASINFYAYNASGNKGIAAGLTNLQKLEDGERLGGGGSTAEQDFGDDLLG